jgi:hypothetical protein
MIAKKNIFIICALVLSAKFASAHVIVQDIENLPTTNIIWQYIQLGFNHIIPKGFDHILFILSLFFFSPKLKSIFFQSALFTLAHSCTLILSSLKVFSPSPTFVEPLIALSILYVAVENIFVSKNRASRSVIIFLLGLLHGLGFAGVLSEIGIPTSHFYTALISFNIGVEMGQIAVILLAYFTITKWFYQKVYYRKRFIIPISATIAVIAAYLTIERLL